MEVGECLGLQLVQDLQDAQIVAPQLCCSSSSSIPASQQPRPKISAAACRVNVDTLFHFKRLSFCKNPLTGNMRL